MSVRVAGYIMVSMFALCGSLCLLAAMLNWEWFFRSSGVRGLVGRLRRGWQRAIYAIVGTAMIAMAIHIIRTIHTLSA